VREVSPTQLEQVLEDCDGLDLDVRRWAVASGRACLGGVRRAHLVPRASDGALLEELYTRDGIGTLIAVEAFEGMRTASARDLAGIVELIRPLEEKGVARAALARAPRARESISSCARARWRRGRMRGALRVRRRQHRRGVVLRRAPRLSQGGQGERLLAYVESALRKRACSGCSCSPRTPSTGSRNGATCHLRPTSCPMIDARFTNPQRASKVLLKEIEVASR